MKPLCSRFCRRVRHGVLVACAVLAVAGGLTALAQSGPAAAQSKGGGKGEGRKIAVAVAPILRQDVVEETHSLGTVVAAAAVRVKSRIDGELIEAAFTEGQMVRKGDLLFRIDPRPLQAVLEQAQAILARDRAQLESARADLGRASDLSRSGFGTSQRLDQARAEAQALASTVAADEAAVALARLNLGYTEIRSPIDGKTGPLLISVGNLVKANDTAHLVAITSVDPVRISFTQPQQRLPRLQDLLAGAGIGVAVRAEGDERPPVEGRVDFLANQADSTTGTIELRATLKNADGRLVPGQFVDVGVRLGAFENALTVPAEAIIPGQDGPMLYRVNAQGKAEAVTVTVPYTAGGVAVVRAPDLAEGQKVVVDGHLQLAPGMTVDIKPPVGTQQSEAPR